jgi:1,4-dihydroxy-2-naphthoate polyprenyltransferase
MIGVQAGEGSGLREVVVPRPSRVGAWLHAFRIPTLAASVVPVLVGTAVAWRHGASRPLAALAALVGSVAIQIGTNLANDIYDFRKGADAPGRIGPPRVLPQGWLSGSEVRTGMIVSFAIAALAGVYLWRVAGWPVVAIGTASIAAGIGYTAGPFALAYVGLGDLAVLLFFGFVAVLGTYYVQAGTVHPEAVLAAIPVGALATAILIVNNVRDLDRDRAAGKRTLAVLLGRRGARAEFLAFLIAAYAVPLGLWAQGFRSAWILLPFATGPLAMRALHAVRQREDGPALNRALLDTARLHALFGVLFAAGIVLG